MCEEGSLGGGLWREGVVGGGGLCGGGFWGGEGVCVGRKGFGEGEGGVVCKEGVVECVGGKGFVGGAEVCVGEGGLVEGGSLCEMFFCVHVVFIWQEKCLYVFLCICGQQCECIDCGFTDTHTCTHIYFWCFQPFSTHVKTTSQP